MPASLIRLTTGAEQWKTITALIGGLHGFSIALGLGIGLVCGFVFAMLTYRFYGKNFRNTFDQLSDDMKAAFKGLTSEALASSQQELVSLADRELGKKTEQHSYRARIEKGTDRHHARAHVRHAEDSANGTGKEPEERKRSVGQIGGTTEGIQSRVT